MESAGCWWGNRGVLEDCERMGAGMDDLENGGIFTWERVLLPFFREVFGFFPRMQEGTGVGLRN